MRRSECGEEVLRRIQERVRDGKYVLTIHAEEEMANDGLSLRDVENGVLAGVIQKRQKDLVTGGWKYLIRGKT